MKRATIFLGAATLMVGCGGQQASTSYNSFDPSLGQPPSAMGSGPTAIPNAAAWPSENGRKMLVFGVGIPSLDKLVTGPDDIAKNKDLDQALTEAAGLGFNVVRVPLFGNATGLKIGKDGLVDGLGEGVERNLATLGELAKAKKLKLYLTLGDSFAGFEKNPLSDTKAQAEFFKNAVAPVTRKMKGVESMFAICVLGTPTVVEETDPKKSVTADQIRAFIKAGSETIKRQDPERLVAAGPFVASKISDAPPINIGLDLFAISADQGLGPIQSMNLNRPLLLNDVASKDGDVKINAMKAVQVGYAGFFYPNLGWKGAESESALLDKDGKPTAAAEGLRGAIKELASIAANPASPATQPPTP